MPLASVLTNSQTSFICPYVSTFTVSPLTDIDDSVVDSVTVSGIDNIFDLGFNTDAECQAFLKSFTVTGYTTDISGNGIPGDHHMNPQVNDLVVTITGSTFADSMVLALDTAIDSTSTTLKGYLEQLVNAGLTDTFGAYLNGNNSGAPTITGSADANGTGDLGNDVTANNVRATNKGLNTGADESVPLVAVSSVANISNFHAYVDVAPAQNGLAIVADITNNGLWALNSIFRQIPATKITPYLDDARHALRNPGLPLSRGDNLVIVVDVVSNATAPLRADQASADGTYSGVNYTGSRPGLAPTATISLSTQRCAFRFAMNGSGGTGAFDLS